MFTEPTEPANFEEVIPKTREDIEWLKSSWKSGDQDWNLYEAPGFEAHYEELRTYQELYFAEQEAVIDAERQARHDEMKFFMNGSGLNSLQEVTVRLAVARINTEMEYKSARHGREVVIDECIDDAMYLLRRTTPEYLLPVVPTPQPSEPNWKVRIVPNPDPGTVKLGGTYSAIVIEPINGLVKLEDSGQSAFLPYTEVEEMREGQRILVSVVAFTAMGLIMVSREAAHHQMAVQLGEEPERSGKEVYLNEGDKGDER